MKTTITKTERARGALLGHLIGDALGAPYEFSKAPPTTLAYGRGVFGHAPGTGTDDTAVMRCAAATLVELGGYFDAETYAAKVVAWANTGPLDIGGQTAKAVRSWERGSPPPPSEGAQGNGALMAVAPCGFVGSVEQAEAAARALSTATHPSTTSADTCANFAGAIAELVAGVFPSVRLLNAQAASEGWKPAGDRIGWCVGSAGLAFRALELVDTGTSAVDALRWVIRQGGDTDTNGAVAGALLGAACGEYPFAELLDGLNPDDVAQNLLLAEGLARL